MIIYFVHTAGLTGTYARTRYVSDKTKVIFSTLFSLASLHVHLLKKRKREREKRTSSGWKTLNSSHFFLFLSLSHLLSPSHNQYIQCNPIRYGRQSSMALLVCHKNQPETIRPTGEQLHKHTAKLVCCFCSCISVALYGPQLPWYLVVLFFSPILLNKRPSHFVQKPLYAN